MWSLVGLIVVAGAGYAWGWSHGSQAGFDKAVEQLEKITEVVIKRRA